MFRFFNSFKFVQRIIPWEKMLFSLQTKEETVHTLTRFLKFTFLICCLWLNNSKAFSQYKPNSDKEKIEYQEEGAYDKFPVDNKEIIKDNEGREFHKHLRSTYTSDDFIYEEELKDKLSFWSRLERKIAKFFDAITPKWISRLDDILVYGLIIFTIVALVFILYRIAFSKNAVFRREMKEQEEGDLVFVQKNLEKIDVNHYLSKAIADEKWNLAIRYLHLMNLQLLARKELIKWDYRKTNHDILNEIHDEKLRLAFESTTRVFNYAWFGDFSMDEVTYHKISQEFIHFNKQLQ